ncbi:sensor histidine kinase [Undibacterium sp. Di24W]|uniref:sensor histidine kinase n=1 Tax=Undibacterium sp. Di24W TaxID=3413033 RepID=UPI003BF2E6E3
MQSTCRLENVSPVLALQACTRVLSDAEVAQQFPQAPRVAEPGIWVVVKFHAKAGDYLLDLGLPDAYYVQVFHLQQVGLLKLMSLNPQSKFKEREFAHRTLLAPLSIQESSQKNEQEVLVHYRTHGKTPLFMRLFLRETFLQRDTVDNLLNGILIGFLLVVIPLLVIGFQSVQNRNYRLYAALVITNLAFLLQIEGYSFQFLWPDSPDWNMRMPNLIACNVMFWHVLFAIQFLQMRQRLLTLYLCHIASLWIIIPVFFLELFWDVEELILALSACYAALAMYTAYRGLRQQIPAARFYFIGTLMQAIFIVGLLFISITFGNPFPQFAVLTYPKIGYLGEALFFAAAVVQQIRLFGERQAELRQRRLVETEQLLHAEQSKLKALDKARQQQLQLASASHDIAQPLASLRFALAALGQKPENKAIAEHVENTLNYAQSLLKELIVQTRQEQSANSTRSAEEIDLRDLFSQLAQEFEVLAQQKALNLAIHRCQLTTSGSSVLLYRILSNLLANAIRYTEHGRIVLGVRRRRDSIEIQIWDTGPGIPAHTVASLTQAFQQGAQAQQSTQGYGLGLFIVQTLCMQCGYQLSIHSELGKGSGFCVGIPL